MEICAQLESLENRVAEVAARVVDSAAIGRICSVCGVTKPLTEEQLAVLRHCPRVGQRIVIQAYAGTGKTTTARLLAARLTPLRVLYLTYGVAPAVEARESMPPNVDSRTIHSLAWKYALHCGAPMEGFSVLARPVSLKGKSDIDSFERFCRDCTLRDPLQPACRQAWARMQSGEEPYTYDGLLKKMTVGGLESLAWVANNYDVIMLDEAQDSQPTFLHWLENLGGTLFYAIGDCNQSIYSFNGTVNAMQRLGSDGGVGGNGDGSGGNSGGGAGNSRDRLWHYSLTQSFRFGENVGRLATKILREAGLMRRGTENCVCGLRSFSTDIFSLKSLPEALLESRRFPITCLARTNETLFTHLFSVVDVIEKSGSSVSFIGRSVRLVEQMRLIMLWPEPVRRIEHERLMKKRTARRRNPSECDDLSDVESLRIQALEFTKNVSESTIVRALSVVVLSGDTSPTSLEEKPLLDGIAESNGVNESANGTVADSAAFVANADYETDEIEDGEPRGSGDDDQNAPPGVAKTGRKESDPILFSDNQSPAREASILYGTIHSSKGLEWDRVALLEDEKQIPLRGICEWLRRTNGYAPGEDFDAMSDVLQKRYFKRDREEVIEDVHLCYVASTRARCMIFLNKEMLDFAQNV